MSTPTRDGRHRRDGRDGRRPDAHPSFAVRRRPRLPARTHARMHGEARRINHDPGRSPRGPGRNAAEERLRAQTPYSGPNVTNLPFSLRFIRTHTPYCTSVYPIVVQKNSRRARADTPVGRPDDPHAMDAGDDRESATRGRREEATSDEANGRPCREGYRTGYSPCSRWVRETTRRDGRVMDGWMDGWMREARDARWMDDAMGSSVGRRVMVGRREGDGTIGSGVCRRAWGGKTASERTRRRG